MLFFSLILFLKVVVDETRQLLESLNGISVVHAKFYELSSSYNKVFDVNRCSYLYIVLHRSVHVNQNIPG